MPTGTHGTTAKRNAAAGSVDGKPPLLDDASKIREAAGRRGPTPRPAQTPPAPAQPEKREISLEEKKFWCLNLAMVWNSWAGPRKWTLMPGAPVDPTTGLPKAPTDPEEFAKNVGEPLVRTLDQVLPMIDQRPWLQLTIVMAPFWGSALQVETARAVNALRARRAAAEGRTRSDPGADRPGQDPAGDDASAVLTPGLELAGEDPGGGSPS
jgi:hypothetical protein